MKFLPASILFKSSEKSTHHQTRFPVARYFESLKILPFPPVKSDPRWPVAAILGTYLLLGVSMLGFNRTPGQMVITVLSAAALEMVLAAFFKRVIVFPLSAIITAFGLCLLLNYSHSYIVALLPVYFAIASKYVFTWKERHIFNPGLFGVVASLLLTESLITAAPAYQWNGISAMSLLIMLPALVLFMPRIGRGPIVVSFILVFTIQTALRAWIMKHHLPFETLFFGTLTSPPFFLFVFFMLTDPATSPKSRKAQIIAGSTIATLDLIFHLFQSYFTFFYAAFLFAFGRTLYRMWVDSRPQTFSIGELWGKYYLRPLILLPLGYILTSAVVGDGNISYGDPGFKLEKIEPEVSGLDVELGDLYESVDPRIQHVIKWIFSVGDAASIADYDQDGHDDVFLTLVLKKKEQRASLYRGNGEFQFERQPLAVLDRYISEPRKYGVITNGLFADYDNDGDKDLFLTVAFGHPILLSNQLIQTGSADFVDVTKQVGLDRFYTNSISATFTDINRDGILDLVVGNVLPENLPGYTPSQRLNLFKLPEEEYPGDRRMFHFMHHSWHEADNGGRNLILMAGKDGVYQELPNSGIDKTHWTLAVSAADFNRDGWPDLHFANDFGPDGLYLSEGGKRFRSVKGTIFGSIGNDTYKGMNSTVADFDRNGWQDIYVSNVHHHLQAEGSLLWLFSQGEDSTPQVEDRATYLGALNERRFGWGASSVDLDLNGWPDIIQANGMVDDTIDKKYDSCPDYWYVNEKIARSPPSYHAYADKWGDIRGMCIYPDEKNRVYLNRGTGAKPQFVDAATALGAGEKSTSRGVAAGDFNSDGRNDLIFTHMFHPPTLYKNSAEKESNWIGISLQGEPDKNCNRDGIGSTIQVITPSKPQVLHTQNATGLLGQNSSRVVFGLEDQRSIDVKVNWCGGETKIFRNLATESYHLLQQRTD